MQPALQSGKHIGCLPAPDKVAEDILGVDAHGAELFDLQNAGDIVIVVIAAAAIGGDVGGGQQPLFLHTQERAAGEPAGAGGFGDLEESFVFHFHRKSLQKTT